MGWRPEGPMGVGGTISDLVSWDCLSGVERLSRPDTERRLTSSLTCWSEREKD